jgi:hypothetical protein
MPDTPIQTFALETYVRRSYNYLTRLVDKDGLPYFNVFWTDPAEAAHDWPDFGDVMPRQLQAAIMARHMTGEGVPLEKTWYTKILSYLDPASGLLFRPKTNYSEHVADIGDQALTLYALVTAYLDNGEESLRQAIFKMVNSLVEKNMTGSGFWSGFIIKPLMACARYMDCEPALRLAGSLARKIFTETPLFSPDNTFRHGGHMHGNLRALVGAADYALYTGDPVLYSRMDALYRYVRSESTRFGFLPEVIGRKGDIISSETCALMDYLGLAVTLANHGHPEYWGDVERVTRNHLVESQVTDVSWLRSDSSKPDTPQFTWRDVGERMVGGYAGWSSPNYILAAQETLNAHWGGPELRDKPRAFQNCCGGSGTHAFFTVWKNAARFADGCLSVNLHIDKLLPQAEIRCYQPYQGLLTIRLQEPCDVNVRIPEFVSPTQIQVASDGGEVATRTWGNYLILKQRRQGETLHIRYPLPTWEEEAIIGNPGFRQYHYRVTWKGDTVIRVEPLGNEYETGYSDFDKRQVPIFYGTKGPGPLYRRDQMARAAEPELASIHLDSGALDLWFIPSRAS